MIDLHLHTTASDGTSTPEALVAEARDAGLQTIAVTDHDTVAGIARARAAARDAGLTCVPGIEITALYKARDVHILGYFVDTASEELASFLTEQREDRRRRARRMLDRLAELGMPVDESLVLGDSEGRGRAIGRPLLASALVAAGHVRDMTEAFDRYLGEGKPAYAPRAGSPPRDVIGHIIRSGGVASFAHPGKFGDDSVLETMTESGLTAIEVFHPDHSPPDVEKYGRLARERGLVATGGSDYHGRESSRAAGLGRVCLPVNEYERFLTRVPADSLNRATTRA